MGAINGEREKAVGLRRTHLVARKTKSHSLLFSFHCISSFTVKEESIYGISRLLVSFHCSYFFCLLDFELLSENGCRNQVTEANIESQGWCVCCFEVQRNAPKMDRINRENRDKNTQKKRTERRTALQTTSSDCQRLHTFSSRDMQTRIIIGERTSKRCRATVRLLSIFFPLCRADISHHIEATSTHLERSG